MFERLVDFWRVLAPKWKVLLGVGVALVVVLVVFGTRIVYRFILKDVPPPLPAYETVELNNNVWTAEERQWYYHTSQGSQIMPYDWFVALEQGDNDRPFIAEENLSRFRVIPDTNTLGNPDRLPVGFAKDDPDPVTKTVNVGFSCATCHTAQVTYKGKSFIVDGAPGRLNFDDFVGALVGSLLVTVGPPVLNPKWDRFARKVLKENYNLQNATRLRFEVGEFVKGQLAGVEKQKEADRRLGLTPTKGGFGRIDALGAGGNRLYAKLGDQNLRTLNAPVKIMPLWNTHRYNWVQTNGSIRQPMARNIIEALAVSASVVFPGDPQQNDRFLSSVRTENMFKMETLISRFKTPVWPQSLLGTLDEGKVERGKEHYDLHCAACHAPRMENTPEPGDKVSVRHDKRYFVARLIPAEEVGTDVTDAKNFAERTLDASAIGLSKNEPGPNIIAMVLGGIIQRQYDDRKLSQDQQDEWSGYRDNLLRACVAYPARPLAGIWAAAPYLHNGSVPNLYQLLLPPEQRVKKFCMDSIEYDPVNVGYVYDNNPCSFVLDTSQTGNSNAGHNYGTSLTHEQRLELIEFLKVLPFPEGDYETTEPQATCPQPGTPGAVPTATPKSGWW